MRTKRPIISILAGLGMAAGLRAGVAEARPFLVVRSQPDAWMIVDPDGVETVANSQIRRMWTVTVQRNILNDDPPQPGYVRALNEYDCATQKLRWTRFTAFSRNGETLLNRENPSKDWTDVNAAGSTLVEWRVACGYSRGDSVIEADGVAKVVIALMRGWDAAAPAVQPDATLTALMTPTINLGKAPMKPGAKPAAPPPAKAAAAPAKAKAPPPAKAKAP